MGTSDPELYQQTIEPYRDPLYDEYYNQVLEGLQQGIKPYKGKMVAPLTEQELEGLAGLGALGETQQAQQRLSTLQGMIGEDLPFDVGPQEYEDFYTTAIEKPAREGYQDAIQEILHRYGSGGRTGRVVDELGRSASQFELGLAAQHAGVRLQGAERRQDLLMQNRAMQPNIMAASRAEEAFGPTMQVESGAYLQRHEQAKANAKFYKWMMQQQYNNPWLGHIGGALSGSPFTAFTGGYGSSMSPWMYGAPVAGDFLQGLSNF